MNTEAHFTTPDGPTLANMRAGMEFLRAFHDLMPRAPITYGMAFLAVAMDPGHGASHYGKRLGFQQPVISRILLEIGQKSPDGGAGYGLLDSRTDLNDLRHKRYHLTSQGWALLIQINRAIERTRKGQT